MTALAALPTTRDEDWRYADPAVLARLYPAALGGWKEIALAPGEVRCKELLLDDAQAGIHRVRVAVGAGARAELFAVLSAAAYTRLEVEVMLGEGAHFQFGGVTIGGGDGTREIVTRVNHAEPNASSDQVVRSVHWDTATGNFLGRIAVARHAQKTDAGQSFKGLLLSKGASANTKPELEIFADDVKCAHGAAIGQMDQAAAFYMAARGLPPELARKLLVRAFVADAFAAHGEPDALLEAALGALEDAA
jgi:Fe-S cluster assembly protein SufD